MSWIWPEYIARELPLTRKQRKAVRREAWRLWWASKRNVALYLTLPAAYLLTVPFASDVGGRIAALLGGSGFTQRLLRAAAPFVLFIACFIVGGAVLQRYRFAPCVYRALRRHGFEVCALCGYWLKGLGDDAKRCPECGAKI